MTQMAADIFMNMNNRRCLWLFGEHDGLGLMPPGCFASALPYDVANDLFGINEADEETVPTCILPMVNESSRPSNIHSYMKSHQNEIEVLYECPCLTDQKLRHHPDYSKPLQIMMLCRKCHAAEHNKINRHNEQLLINMIAVKMFCKSPRPAGHDPRTPST